MLLQLQSVERNMARKPFKEWLQDEEDAKYLASYYNDCMWCFQKIRGEAIPSA